MTSRRFININTASFEELHAIPGIDSELARQIVEIRKIKGPIRSLEGLKIISGLTDNHVRTLQKHAILGDATMLAPAPAWIDWRLRLLEKFRAVYRKNAALISEVDERISHTVEASNPKLGDVVSSRPADEAFSQYLETVMHAADVLDTHPGIEFVDTYRVEAGEKTIYDEPVIICRRFELGAGARFVVGPSINPTFIIITEELDVDPTARWEWQPHHPSHQPPGPRPARARDGRPNHDPFEYTSRPDDDRRGADGGDGDDGIPGVSHDDADLARSHGACEGPTVQIIALRILSTPVFDLSGQDGARGGRGQDGGNGGAGARGRRSRKVIAPVFNPLLIPPVVPVPFCEREPGFGGNGGTAGAGGDGGRGGRGGDGGSLRLFTTPDSWQALLEGGWTLTPLIGPGQGGGGGPGGWPGEFGPGGQRGRAEFPCQAEHARAGMDGGTADPGLEGPTGAEGDIGNVELYTITDLDFAEIRQMPYIHQLYPDNGPPGTRVVVAGHNLDSIREVVFTAVSYPVPLLTDPGNGLTFFIVPDDAVGGWAHVRLIFSAEGDPFAPFDIRASELDFTVTPCIDSISPALPDRAIWLDEVILSGRAFRPGFPHGDRVRILVDGTSYGGIVDLSRSGSRQIVFSLPQTDSFVDHPAGDWEVDVISVDGYASNSVLLGLHSCLAMPFRTSPMFPNRAPNDYPYWPNGLYFQNFSEGLPDWDLFLDTYGPDQIAERIALDVLWNAVALANLPAITPAVAHIPGASELAATSSLLTLAGTIGPYYAFWFFFLNGVIPAAHCTGMSTVALRDYLTHTDCFNRPWNDADFTAKRLITAATSRLLTREALLDQMYPQCQLEADSIPPTLAEIRERLDETTASDHLPLLMFIPSGEMTDLEFWTTIIGAHTVAPYMIIDDIETRVEIGGVPTDRIVTRIYIYDSNRPFAAYFDTNLAADSDVSNAFRPEPADWHTLPNCTAPPTPMPCFSPPPGPDPDNPTETGVNFISVWNEGTPAAPDWRYHYDDPLLGMDDGFTLGWAEFGLFNGAEFCTLPLESPFGFVPQVLELLMSPATVAFYRLNRERDNCLGEEISTQSLIPSEEKASKWKHQLHSIPTEERAIVRVISGLEEGGQYSYRSFDQDLDVAVAHMPLGKGDQDILITDPVAGIIEFRTLTPGDKFAHLVIQRQFGDELRYVSISEIAVSPEYGLYVRLNDEMNHLTLSGGVPRRRCKMTLYRLSPDGRSMQHETELLLGKKGVTFEFDSWAEICTEEIPFPESEPLWLIKDQINMSTDHVGEVSRQQHDYQSASKSQSQTVTGKVIAGLEDASGRPIAAARSLAQSNEHPRQQGVALCHLGRAEHVECFKIGNLVPTLPVRIVKRMATQGTQQLDRVYVNDQRIARSDWETEYKAAAHHRRGRNAKRRSHLPSSLIYFDSEFIVPASYVTASHLEVRIETLETDFPPQSRGYWFYQDCRLDVVETPKDVTDLSAEVTLSSGRRISLKTLIDLTNDRQVIIGGIRSMLTPDGYHFQPNLSKAGTPIFEVRNAKYDKEGRLRTVTLSDGARYGSKVLVQKLLNGDFTLSNAWLEGTRKNPRVRIVGQSRLAAFDDEIKALLAKRRPLK
ncbi:MAG: helix-hairpin-helix domain-containing protein [Gammaproteobacteria bacterium]|nr:helix-hairpin-helix domain-containing protein [Gammaproteobacteria bacterium]